MITPAVIHNHMQSLPIFVCLAEASAAASGSIRELERKLSEALGTGAQ